MINYRVAALSRRAFLGGALMAGTAMAVGRPTLADAVHDELALLDGLGSAQLVRSKRVSALELVDAAIRRIERLEPEINALISESFERARARARGPVGNGAFAGVPYLLKDLLDYPGVRMTAGSRMLAANVPDWRSDYVAATEAAGLIVLGKSATPEFGLLATTEPLLNGPTRNPWNPNYSPGGSSGGAAAAVAARMVPFAHASDGGGSIRIPASACGVFGLKPTRGRQVSARRAQAGADLALEHCVSRSVRDSAMLLSLTERRDSQAPFPPVGFVSGPDKRRLKIGFTTVNYYGRDAEPSVKRAIEQAAKLCEDLGHHVFEARWPFDGAEFIDQFMVLWSAAAAGVVAGYKERTGRDPDDSVLEPWTLAVAAEYAARPKDALSQALAYLERTTQAYDSYFADYDAFLSPVLRRPSVLIGEQSPTQPYAKLREELIDWGSYTPMQNLAGVPAMSVPLGVSDEGVPIGSQFTGRRGSEAMLLALAYELERAQPWSDRRPMIVAT